jgi:hypothetical protein
MRQVHAMVLALCCGVVLGCFTPESERTTAHYQARSPFQGPTGDKVVQLLVALVERPVGDLALNQEIWSLADEQSIDLERKVLLEDNGFRMGQFGSLPPASLRNLIFSERSCANPRLIRIQSGNPTTVVLGTTQNHCSFELVTAGQKTPVDLDQAVCQFQIVPTLTPDGHTRLEITPLIKHGQIILDRRPITEPSGTLRWDVLARQPVETYSDLAWQQTLEDSEYLIIGAELDRPNTLGQRCFIQVENDPPIQRLLVLRALRGGLDANSAEELLSRSPSIAAQAGLSTARGVSP